MFVSDPSFCIHTIYHFVLTQMTKAIYATSLKGQIINIFSFEGHKISVATIQLFC